MQVTKTQRGFERIDYPAYVNHGNVSRLVQTSSAVGNYPDGFDRPGSSYLWVGGEHHLDREQVAELVRHLTAWIETGSLVPADVAVPPRAHQL